MIVFTTIMYFGEEHKRITKLLTQTLQYKEVTKETCFPIKGGPLEV